MCSSIDLARIFLIEETNKGYTKLVLSNPIPWRTRYLRFNVWRKDKLYHDGKEYKVGDMVSVEYTQEDFDKLVSLEPVEPTQVDSCLVCYGLYEVPRDGERIDCGRCSVFDINKRRRLNAELKLTTSTSKRCTYSMGQCLEFVDEMRDKLYFVWSFSRESLLYTIVHTQDARTVYRQWVDSKTDWWGELFYRFGQCTLCLCIIIVYNFIFIFYAYMFNIIYQFMTQNDILIYRHNVDATYLRHKLYNLLLSTLISILIGDEFN